MRNMPMPPISLKIRTVTDSPAGHPKGSFPFLFLPDSSEHLHSPGGPHFKGRIPGRVLPPLFFRPVPCNLLLDLIVHLHSRLGGPPAL
ncbi:MAG TPA: hypothetical protein DCR97_01880 [Deltaproteobacteria bacterium]|nr:hypothetical protein [Deltaproteobacteria bacterium]